MRLGLLLLITILVSSDIYSQSIDIIYRSSKTRYSLDDYLDKFVKTDNPNVIQMIRNTYGKAPSFDFKLVYSNNSSIYNTCDVDSKVFLNAKGKRQTVSKASVNDYYYNNFQDNSFISSIISKGTTYNIKDKVIIQPWKILNDELDILGYKCKKAILPDYRGWEITAWFAPDIPVSIGPLEYGGLPGAILRVERGAMLLTAIDIGLKNENTSIAPPANVQSEDETTYTFNEFLNYEATAEEFRKRAIKNRN